MNKSISSFEWKNPTHLIIKEDASPEIANYLARDGKKKVLLVMGQGSVKKYGIYDKVVAALASKGIQHIDFEGVRANPEIKTVCKAIDVARENNVDAILPLGGGSVYDSCKAIAVGATFDKSIAAAKVWECYEGTREVMAALPIYGVLTISATATEMNDGNVV